MKPSTKEKWQNDSFLDCTKKKSHTTRAKKEGQNGHLYKVNKRVVKLNE